MIEIRSGFSDFFNVTNTTEWDSTMNNGSGGNKLVIEIEPNWPLTQMQTDITELKTQIQSMQQEKDTEVLLREANPGLKEAYEKYQTVYKLVKQTVNTIEGDSSAV